MTRCVIEPIVEVPKQLDPLIFFQHLVEMKESAAIFSCYLIESDRGVAMSTLATDVNESYTMEILRKYSKKYNQVTCRVIQADEEEQEPLSELLLTQAVTFSQPRDSLACTFLRMMAAPRKAFVEDPARFDKLMGMYAIDLLRKGVNKKLSMVERYKPSSFPFFVDLDFKSSVSTINQHENHHLAIKELQNALVKFFPSMDKTDERLAMICCSRVELIETKESPPNAEGVKQKISQKTHGYHLHWPNIVVTCERALIIRESMINQLHKATEACRLSRRLPCENSWEDAFDKSVYNKGGLRSIGSFKFSRNPLNNEINISQKVDGYNVTYWPAYALDGLGKPFPKYNQIIDRTIIRNDKPKPKDELTVSDIQHMSDMDTALIKSCGDQNQKFQLAHDMISLCRLTRVRTNDALTDGFDIPVGAPRPGMKVTDGGYSINDVGQGQISMSHYIPVSHNRELCIAECTKMIRSAGYFDNRTCRMIPWWPEISVSDVSYRKPTKKYPKVKSLAVAVKGNGSSFCLNLKSRSQRGGRGADHRSNHIWFIISNEAPYLQQRCHCTCDTTEHRYRDPQKDGPRKCCNFTSNGTGAFVAKISDSLSQIITSLGSNIKLTEDGDIIDRCAKKRKVEDNESQSHA